VASHAKFVPVTGTDENGFACQLKQYNSQGLKGVQVGTAIYAYALALKTALGVLSGHSEPNTVPIQWETWNTAQSIQQCNPKYSAALFLQTESASSGIDISPAVVNSYL
jgi:hypothetical protein